MKKIVHNYIFLKVEHRNILPHPQCPQVQWSLKGEYYNISCTVQVYIPYSMYICTVHMYSIYVQILVKNCANSNLNIPIKTEQINRFVFYHLLTYVLVYLAPKPVSLHLLLCNMTGSGLYAEIQIIVGTVYTVYTVQYPRLVQNN